MATLWFALSLGLAFVLSVCGVLMLLLGWKLNPVVGESRWLFFTLYSTIICLVVVAIFLLQSVTHYELSSLAGWLSVVLSLFWIPIYVSKFVHLRKLVKKVHQERWGHQRDAANRSGASGDIEPLPASVSRIVIHSGSSGACAAGVAASAGSAQGLPPVQYPPAINDVLVL